MVDKSLPESNPDGGCILLVEDDPITREVLLDFLQSEGLCVEVAEDGAAGVALASAGAYAAILMDMEMPRMGGVEATRRIRQLPSHAGTPIIAITANASAAEREACIVAGMVDFLAKPVDAECLHATLSKWLPGGRQGFPGAAADIPQASPPGTPAREPAPLPGVDSTEFVAALHGDAAKYRRLLERMCDSQADDLERLRSRLAAGERMAAAQLAHRLAGAALMIGASRVGGLARGLEQVLRAEDGSPEGNSAVAAAVAAIDTELATIRNALHAPGA